MVKQKTAYEMRSSDWISYVCSSDLPYCPLLAGRAASSTVMKRSTRSLTCNVDMPARSCSSSISKTDASSLPETRISASSSDRSEEHTSELQSLMRISYAVFCLKKKTNTKQMHMSTHDRSQQN